MCIEVGFPIKLGGIFGWVNIARVKFFEIINGGRCIDDGSKWLIFVETCMRTLDQLQLHHI